MLGYSKDDLDEMIKYVGIAYETLESAELKFALSKTSDFLQGLWAEGYFDNE